MEKPKRTSDGQSIQDAIEPGAPARLNDPGAIPVGYTVGSNGEIQTKSFVQTEPAVSASAVAPTKETFVLKASPTLPRITK